MPRKKKTTITTYEVFIRTPKGENPIITTTDRDKAFKKYRENLGICRLRIDGEELKILEADKLTYSYKLTSARRFEYPQKAKKTNKTHELQPAQ